MADDFATKDLVDRALTAERALTDEKFRSRDHALTLLAEGLKSQKAVYVAIGLSLLGIVMPFILKFVVK
jgi:hypothetical protein